MKWMGGRSWRWHAVFLAALCSPVISLAVPPSNPPDPDKDRPTVGRLIEKPAEKLDRSSAKTEKPRVAAGQRVPPAARPAAGGDPPTYRIGKEDVLQVLVFGEESLSLPRVPVRPDGKISLPLLGDIQAEGATPDELARSLTDLYRVHIRAPSVTVTVVEVNSFKVFVVGKVETPGVLTFGRQTSLLQALAQAGGFAEFANTKRILIIREGARGPQRIVVNYEKIVSGEDLSMNLQLQPGDTIVVP
ncbi:MAG: polysaccharide biosynthesis/export family protein [Acidobacteriota bacterium]